MLMKPEFFKCLSGNIFSVKRKQTYILKYLFLILMHFILCYLPFSSLSCLVFYGLSNQISWHANMAVIIARKTSFFIFLRHPCINFFSFLLHSFFPSSSKNTFLNIVCVCVCVWLCVRFNLVYYLLFKFSL